jgi:hypothetical protein
MTATTLLHALIVRADLPATALARVSSKLGDVAVRRRETVDELHTQVVAILLDVLDSAELTPQEPAEIRERRGRLLLQMGDLETGYRELELALPQLHHEPVEAARAMTLLGFPLADPRPAATYLERLERAAAVAARISDPAERLALIGDRPTATQLIAAIRRVGGDVPGAAELIEEVCSGHDYSQPGKPRIAWDDEAARDQLVSALVNDALALLEALDLDAIESAGGKPAEAVALLALVAGQDVEPADDSDAPTAGGGSPARSHPTTGTPTSPVTGGRTGSRPTSSLSPTPG